jgi:hypothetical protein
MPRIEIRHEITVISEGRLFQSPFWGYAVAQTRFSIKQES